MTSVHIGIDDTDSPRMGCTTYIASLLIEKLDAFGVSFFDYPNLIRLNPNVPWKTRGNGALCLRLDCPESKIQQIEEITLSIVEKNSDLEHPRTEPGVVFYFGRSIPEELKDFAQQAIQGIVKLKDALKLIEHFNAEAVGFKSGRGIVGALAAIGEDLSADHTFELIAYRTPVNRGSPRQMETASVAEMDQKTKPLTFNNMDPETKRILIMPHGPDPILYGIRGETPSIVKRAQKIVRSLEPIERWTIFRTNQGTDAHLHRIQSISDIEPFNPIIVKGTVAAEPTVIPRRHVIFPISDASGQIDCAAYEPTVELRRIAQKLIKGDVIEAHGGVRPPSKKRPITVNLEKINVLELAPNLVYHNPLCQECGKRMESMGKGKGFRCPKCGFRSPNIQKEAVEKERYLKRRIYVTSPRSQRHLTRPLSRDALKRLRKPEKKILEWFKIERY